MKIAVIMSTYNGEKFLSQQIDSILNQDIKEYMDLEVFIRDDGSLDQTRDILKSYSTNPQIHIFLEKNEGYGKSFINCLHRALNFDYYAFCDQDDYWEKDKLRRAIDILNEEEKKYNLPTLYYSNVKVSDDKLKIKRITKLHLRKMTLEGVFMRRSIPGCTMVFNQKLWYEIYKNEITDDMLLQGHDSFIVSLCYAVGGIVYCDKNAYMFYRQHNSNTAGAPSSIKKRIKKETKLLFSGKTAEMKISDAILKGWYDEIPEKNRESLKLMSSIGTNWKAKLKIVLSNDYITGDMRLTIFEKIKVLFAKA